MQSVKTNKIIRHYVKYVKEMHLVQKLTNCNSYNHECQTFVTSNPTVSDIHCGKLKNQA